MRIGLALSGGGFRATLFHLGLIRFLRDADILRQVTHITSVSGGSIMAAHLALHWDRYTGSTEDFDKAAAHLLDFIRLDVRNRIVRRFPLGLLLRWPRRLLGLSNRQLTRTGLLERQYEQHLFGDKSLFELPQSPELHILATNISKGCLCSFSRDGLWMMQQKGGQPEIERIRVGLMTVPMAVAASSAFPGFFPPLELTGRDVGAHGGEFVLQAYTDGGVFDNLGVRMFRWLTPLLTGDKALDGVLVSDVGKAFEVQNRRAGGLVRTAMRASDILMNRVWQLESENFQDTLGFVFARLADVVGLHEDATALHPEIQRQMPGIRTDLDAFSPLEISCLIRHGYCTARKACRSRPDLFAAELPTTPPWDPVPPEHIPPHAATASQPEGMIQDTAPATIQARLLQLSASRRIWGNLFRIRDWTSYIYVPLLFCLLVLLPYITFRYYVNSRRVNRLDESLALSSPHIDILRQLMAGPIEPFQGEAAEEVQSLEPPNDQGFTVLQDSCIVDLRPWNPSTPTALVYGSRRLKVLRDPASAGSDIFRVVALPTHPDAQFRFPPSQIQPRLRRCLGHASTKEASCKFEVSVDLSKAPRGQVVDLVYEHYSRGVFVERRQASTTVTFHSDVDALELSRWFLLPAGEEYRSYQILRYETGKPGTVEVVQGFTDYLVDDSSIVAFKLALVKAGHTYEVTWFHK